MLHIRDNIYSKRERGRLYSKPLHKPETEGLGLQGQQPHWGFPGMSEDRWRQDRCSKVYIYNVGAGSWSPPTLQEQPS